MLLKVSTTRNVPVLIVQSSDHVTGLTGATLTITASKDGGAFASITPTVTELASGWYSLALTTTHTNTKGSLALHVTAASADPTDVLHEVVTDLPGDTVASVSGAVGSVTAQVTANVAQWNSTNVATPATAGIPEVNVKNINNVAATSVTTINANVGTTQPVNFTGTGASALAKSDMVDVAGAAVSTSAAQIGVNAVNIGGTAQTGRDIGASVLLSPGTGTGQLDFTSGVVKANLAQILGTALTETAGQIAGGFKKFFNIATPAATMDHGVLVDTVTTATTATNLTNAPTNGDFTAAMKTSLNAATPSVTVSDKTGFSLSAAAVQAIWDALTSALTTAGSIGKLLVDRIDAAISSRSTLTQAQILSDATPFPGADIDAAISTRLATSGYTAPLSAGGTRSAVGLASANLDTQLAAIQSDTDDMQTRLPAALVGGKMDSHVNDIAAGAITATSIAANAITAAKIATDAIGAAQLAADAVAEISDEVWDEPIAGHLGAGSTGAALNAAGSAGDPWVTLLPGAYGAGSAGFIVGTNLDAPVSGTAVPGDQMDLVNAPNATGLAAIADAILKRDWTSVTGEASRSVLNALRFLRNKWYIVGATLHVTKEDDATDAWTGALSTQAGADPITGVDPT